jgi:ABC-type multidrug transport system fused ATPase/permease subunit
MDSLKTNTNYSFWNLIKDISRFLRPYKWRFLLGSLLRLSGDLAWLYPTYAFASLITLLSQYHQGMALAPFWRIMELWIFASIWYAIAHHLAKYFCHQVGNKISLDAQLQATEHLFALDVAWHEKENAGNKLKRILSGGQALENSIKMWVTNVIEIAVNFIGMIFIIAKTDRLVSIFIMAFLLTYFLISFYLVKKASLAAMAVNEVEEDFHGLSFEALNNIRSVKMMAMAPALLALLRKVSADLFEKIKIRISRFQSRGGILSVWGQAFRLGTLIFIAYGIIQGHYVLGFLVLFNGYFMRLWESVSELSDIAQDFIIAKYGVARMMHILNEPMGIDRENGKLNFDSDWKTISVRNLTFSYGQVKALDNVSFDIQRGEKIGIVGLSGAGKSTLFKLLLKENEDYSGEIFIDSMLLQKVKKSSYLEHVAVVPQETEVFNLSLRDNITIAKQQISENAKQIEMALNVAHVSDFLHKLPNGLETSIGEKGVRLSGGEKQRLGIARAVFKQPQVLFLDEATSHLDLESEEKIQDSLHQFFNSVTALVIAHRLTTIREMDRIIVIENGKIIESGSFDELYKKGGRFFELWEKQKL